MHYLKRQTKKNGDDGVSPIVGVMLMLVVTIILAAVVSAFAGGSMNGSQKAPTLNAEFHIKNGGTDATSYFSMKVLGVSEPIPTRNLQLITSWTTTNKTDGTSIPPGGNTSSAGRGGVFVNGETQNGLTVPTGYGNGVTGWANDISHPPDAMWGNFTLTSGTSTFDRPSQYGLAANGAYAYGTSHNPDPMQSILGGNWSYLRTGDTVTVRVVDLKSGKTLVDQNVMVEG
ncbi:type IV pilin N-terminal domain-containing protein [Methanoregula sp.]|uniref:type IV pilin N-terminal domain-containing protein n=1 Tax=Methanoregula sp. TaxID=2052170 RepID=UPI00236D6F35|nr:type IV pilin N-terminal domain-containing protein [Methanoregula sp.]MDD1686433.1 type IV pilin N-terminal domain-containing protein [Methanoregula sp.]